MKTKIVETTINQEQRFIIIDEETNNILDDSNGKGFKYIEWAYKSTWFRYSDSKENVLRDTNETKKFFEENPTIKDFIIDYYDIHFKDSMRGITVTDNLIEAVKEKFGIELKKFYIKYF